MSARKPTPGVDVRHARSCRTKNGSRCSCAPTFQAMVYDRRAGKRIRKSFPTITAAKLWRQDALVALRKGELRASAGAPTVKEAMTDLIAGMRDGRVLTRSGTRYKPGTIRVYERSARDVIGPELGSVRLTDVRRRDVQALADRMRAAGAAASTVWNRLDVLRVTYRRAIRDEIVSVDPTAKLDLPAIRAARKDVSGAAVERLPALLAALRDTERAMWATAAYAGLRRGELRALRWSDVDLDAGVIRVSRGWDDVEGEQDAKSEAGRRTVPVAPQLRRELAAQRLRTGRRGDALVFGATASKEFSLSGARKRARRAWKAAGVAPLSLHAARHAAASHMIAAGFGPMQVKTYMGHSSITTTIDTYGHLFPGSVAEDGAALGAYHDAGSARQLRGS